MTVGVGPTIILAVLGVTVDTTVVPAIMEEEAGETVGVVLAVDVMLASVVSKRLVVPAGFLELAVVVGDTTVLAVVGFTILVIPELLTTAILVGVVAIIVLVGLMMEEVLEVVSVVSETLILYFGPVPHLLLAATVIV